jgi:hypothetical protein
MKKITYYTAIFCAAFMFAASAVKSQTDRNIVFATEKWHPIKINSASGEVLNGVSFLSKEAECNSQKIVTIKLVNANQYPVSVNYVENNGSKKSIKIPSSSSIEGTCELFSDLNENNPMKSLVYLKPTSDIEKEDRRKVLQTLEVVK